MYKKALLTFFLSFLLIACTDDLGTNDMNVNQNKNVTEVDDSPVAQSETKLDKKERTKSKNDSNQLDQLTVHYIDVGQGDATLFQIKDEDDSYNILYDTGDWKGNEVVPYLNEQQVEEIDIIMISHPHADHIGQLHKVLEQFDVGEVWMSSNTTQSEVYSKAVEAIVQSEADFAEPEAGDVFDIGALQISILHPEELTGDLNGDSIAFHAQYGDTSFLFTGDASIKEEKMMLKADLPIEATILQLGHHGSNTSSDPSFVDAVNPDIAIYSAGEGNKYGHPHKEVVETFARKNIPLYGTDKDGNIVVKTDGKTYEITKEKRKKKKQEVDTIASCINVNKASEEDLQEIMHIGDARAKELIKNRPYQSLEDLAVIDGIGPARISDIIEEGKACIEE